MRKAVPYISVGCVVVACLLFFIYLQSSKTDKLPVREAEDNRVQQVDEQIKKVLYVDSYHEGYPWSDGITQGVETILNADDTVTLRIERMDTKRNSSEAFKVEAALRIKKIIDDWQPDVVIASDDNASKYLVAPFFRDDDLPVVFCGINGDASIYGFPASNITGMLEVPMMPQLIETLKKYAAGTRLGYLAPETYTDRRAFESNAEIFKLNFTDSTFVATFDDWKKEFIRLQSEVDILLMPNYSGIENFDMESARSFVQKHTTIPTGTIMQLMAPLTLVTYGKVAEEQGEWAAARTLQILNGMSPADIDVAYNQGARIHLNYNLARKLGVDFDSTLIEMSASKTDDANYSTSAMKQKDYSGKSLNILTHEIPVMGEPTLLHAGQFEQLTGVKVNIHFVPFNKLYQETVQGLKTGKYDVVFFGSLWLADLYEHLEPVPEELLNTEQFVDILPHYKALAKWSDTTYQVTIDGDRHYFQYRKDLLENPAYKKEYKRKYEKPLAVPETWKEVAEVAEFFHGKKLENGQIIYGMAEIVKKDDLLFSQFIKRAASYAKHPDIKDGFYFDLETMTPQINNPGFVHALEDFVRMQEFYPPGGENFGLADVINSFGDGKVVFSDCWDDAFIHAMEKDSGIADKVATTVSPGSKKVWNRKTEEWDMFDEVNHVPYFSWGWTSGVSKKSENKEAAFDFLGFFGNNKNHFSDLLIGQFGVNPYRESDLNPAFWIERAGWSQVIAESYVATLKTMGESDNWLMDLRIYKSRQYMYALSVGIYRALTGRDRPQNALDEVARRWEQITESVGRSKQREAYAHAVAFENRKVNMESAQ